MTPTYQELVRQRDEQRHAALVRGEDGGLYIRRFASAVDAAAVAAEHRDVVQPGSILPVAHIPRPRRREWRLADVAKELGVSTRTVRRYLPYLKHRQPSPHVTYVDGQDVVLVKLYGLHGLARMRKSGTEPLHT